jgi:NAD(P)-dependent dehydrogenase (short-subunit alcohol dehydrogenase family)
MLTKMKIPLSLAWNHGGGITENGRSQLRGWPAQALLLCRPGYPNEIADVVAFLAFDRAAYMTDEAINVTGGPWMN